MKIINKPIRENNYFKNSSTEKDTIVLHHTVSGNSESPISWFGREDNIQKVGTAFIVGKNGKIFELFNPKYTAYHTGTRNKNNIDFRSIGIEIVNEGYLDKINDKYYWLDGKVKYNGEVFDHNDYFRGKRYFASYTDLQYNSVNFLIEHLFKLFPKIKRTFANSLQFDDKYFDNEVGIISHVNIRKSNKWDLNPAYNLDKINKLLRSYKTDYEVFAKSKPVELD